MKSLKLQIASIIFLIVLSKITHAQSFDFENTIYYTASGNALATSGQSLVAFDYSTAIGTEPLLNNGVYFPINDYLNNNLWLRVRHIANDPNGTTVGYNVAGTTSSPFRLGGFGGWAGFLYQFDIYRDMNLTGVRNDTLNGLYNSNIIVESIETLSQGEWVSFEILNDTNSYWMLNSTNFTGLNPTSTPGFSAVNIPVDGFVPPTGFDTVFPSNSNSIYVVDYNGGSSYAEFRVSANNVSQFTYGYEYNSSGGYQGMRMSFGTAPGAVREIDSKIVQMTPNPANEVVIINSTLKQNARIRIIDSTGKIISTSSIASFPARINVSKLPNGVYTLILSDDNFVVNKQLIVAH